MPINTPERTTSSPPPLNFRIGPVYGNTTDPALPRFTTSEGSCGQLDGSGFYCDVSFSDDVASVIGFEDLQTQLSDIGFWWIEGDDRTFAEFDYEVDREAVGTRNGITLAKSTLEQRFEFGIWELTSYGAWMEYSAFGVQILDLTAAVPPVSLRHSIAGGDWNVAAPTSSATWRGVMVGTPATGADRGDLLQGDATLSYDSQALSATFDNIKNLDKLRAHSVQTVSFDQIPYRENGHFWTGEQHDFIWGNFYGPDHAEAAGNFEKSDIVGAFGANRQ